MTSGSSALDLGQVEHYVRQAQHAEAMAERATGEAERNTWTEVALLWRDLAQRKLAASARVRRPRAA